jgi:hypothetical protein
MNLQCPSRVLDVAHETAGFLIRRCLAREVECTRSHAVQAQRYRHAAVADAVRALRGEAAAYARERLDRGVVECVFI